MNAVRTYVLGPPVNVAKSFQVDEAASEEAADADLVTAAYNVQRARVEFENNFYRREKRDEEERSRVNALKTSFKSTTICLEMLSSDGQLRRVSCDFPTSDLLSDVYAVFDKSGIFGSLWELYSSPPPEIYGRKSKHIDKSLFELGLYPGAIFKAVRPGSRQLVDSSSVDQNVVSNILSSSLRVNVES